MVMMVVLSDDHAGCTPVIAVPCLSLMMAVAMPVLPCLRERLIPLMVIDAGVAATVTELAVLVTELSLTVAVMLAVPDLFAAQSPSFVMLRIVWSVLVHVRGTPEVAGLLSL